MSPTLKWIVKFCTLILGAALVLSAIGLVALIITSVLNEDFHIRSPQSITLRDEKESDRSYIKVKMLVHRLLVDENAVEVSLLVQARYDGLPEEVRNETPCLTLMYADGSEPDSAPKTLDITCKKFEVPGKVISEAISAETPRFNLSAFPSVGAYPFDDWEFFPEVSLLARANWSAPAVYSVERRVPGKELRVTGDHYNWRIHLQRPFPERAMVLTVGIAFLALSLLISWRLFSREVRLSGMQELLALAGFVVAIASLRDLLGVSRTTGVSTWEIVVIGIPMTALCIGMTYSALLRVPKGNVKGRILK
jgi:hypothetical protein